MLHITTADGWARDTQSHESWRCRTGVDPTVSDRELYDAARGCSVFPVGTEREPRASGPRGGASEPQKYSARPIRLAGTER